MARLARGSPLGACLVTGRFVNHVLRCATALAAAAAFLVLDLTPGRAGPPPPEGSIEVLFAPTGKDRRIEAAIADEFDRARKYAAQFEAIWSDEGLAKPAEKPGEGK